MHALRDDGWKHFVRKGAVIALGELQTEIAAGLLIDTLLSPNECASVKVSAASSLVKCVSVLRKPLKIKATECLTLLLKDEDSNVRLAAVQAIGKLPASSEIEKLESTKSVLCAQVHPVVDRSIAAARKNTDESAVKQAQKNIELLEKKVKKLTDRVEELESEIGRVD